MLSLKSVFVAFGLSLLPSLVSGAPVTPHIFKRGLYSRATISTATVQAELGPLLTNGSLIFGPENADFFNATERWNHFLTPEFELVAQPATEGDVSKIVKYCYDNNFDFFVRNRGHGSVKSINNFKGVEIDVSQLEAITIDEEAMTAVFQAGTWARDIVRTLWDAGQYATTSGAAPCVGLLGPALGGGHGRLEGKHGLAGDNILHANVVLANGTEVGVNATSHPDLLWALKGAGHNFAVVTSVVKEIYKEDNWYVHNYIWSQDKLETVFEELNKFHKSVNGTTPVEMGVNFGSILMDPTYSDTEAVISWSFQYSGPGEDAEKLLGPFNAIPSLNETTQTITFVAAGEATSELCVPMNRVMSTVMLEEYNITTQREMYNYYVAKALEYPELAPNAFLYHEGYATAGVKAVPSDSTAYPHRDQNHLNVFFSTVPDGMEELQPVADAWAADMWTAWNNGQPGKKPKTYVNYSQGWPYETLEMIYGEQWRMDKLRALKGLYDPTNKFRFYNPIMGANATIPSTRRL